MILRAGLFVGFASIVLYVIINYAPNVLEPTVWDTPNPLPELVGPLEPNGILGHGEILQRKEFMGPESLSIDDDGTIYASLKTGTVVQMDSTGAFMKDILFVGGFLNGKTYLKQNGFNGLIGNEKLKKFCDTEAREERLPWNVRNERMCGRPLGSRIRKNADGESVLYVLDAYHGLFTVNLKTLKVAHIFSEKTPIQSFDGISPDALKTIKFFNDLDILADGSIIFSDSSYKWHRSQNRPEVMDAAPRGRLLQYVPSTGVLRPLLCGLHFPNGVQVHSEDSGDGDGGSSKVILAESTRFRLLLVDMGAAEFATGAANPLLTSCSEKGSLYEYLEGGASSKNDKKAVSIFLSPVPGFADNLRVDSASVSAEDPDKKGAIFLVGLGTKSTKPLSLLWSLYQTSWPRKLIGLLIPMKYVEKVIPRYGLVLAVNMDGEIVGSMQDNSTRIAWVSEAHRHPISGDLWLGSHHEPHIVRVPKDAVPRYD